MARTERPGSDRTTGAGARAIGTCPSPNTHLSLRAIAFGLVAALGLTACRPAAEEAPAVPKVAAVVVARGTLVERIALPARLQPPSDLDQTLAPQVAGRLTRVAVRQGDVVERGQPLAEVEQADLAGTARAAAAEVEHARREAEAKQRAAELTARLAERGIAAREEREADSSAAAAASAALAEAESRLDEAERNLGRTRLVAPFRGVVVSLLRHAGETVDGTPATAVLRLAGLERSEAVASSTGDVLARLAPGMRGSFSTAAGAPTVDARLVRVARALDPASGLGEIAAEVDASVTLPLFSQGELTLVLGEHPNVVLIPLVAVRRGEDGHDEVVELVRGKAVVHSVRLGARDGASVEVVEGLAGGETIAAEGGLGLEDGAPAEPADGKP